MAIRSLTKLVLVALSVGPLLFGQAEETSTTRLLKSSESDQITYLNNYIAAGVAGDNDDAGLLVRSKTSLFVPLVEQKIVEILQSPSPQHLFKGPPVDVDVVVARLASIIEYTGEEIAVEQARKLMKIDEHRFDSMVEHCLMQADARRRGFQVAYKGLETGDPAVDKRIIAWAEEEIGLAREPDHDIILRKWAEAMVEEYNGIPDEYQWAADPIVSRLSADCLNPPGGTPLHDEMFPLIREAAADRPKK
jgi:hypothetical protein